MASIYYYNFETYESLFRSYEFPSESATMEFRFWKLDASVEGDVIVELNEQIRCNIHRRDVVAESEEHVVDISFCLTVVDIPEVYQAVMIAKFMRYIQNEVIWNGRYTAAMDIVEAEVAVTEVERFRAIEEAIERSVAAPTVSDGGRTEPRSRRRQWAVTDDGEISSWTWPLEASDYLPEAVRIILSRSSRTRAATNGDFLEAVRRSMEEYQVRMVPASEAAIVGLEKVGVKETEGERLNCVICKEDDEVLGFSRMPCKHVFHTTCIETWLRLSSSCPLCRYRMPSF